MSGLSVEFVEIMREHHAQFLRQKLAACNLELQGWNPHGQVFYCRTHDRRFLLRTGEAAPTHCPDEGEPA